MSLSMPQVTLCPKQVAHLFPCKCEIWSASNTSFRTFSCSADSALSLNIKFHTLNIWLPVIVSHLQSIFAFIEAIKWCSAVSCILRWGIERESCEGAFIGRKLEACVSSYVMFIFIFFKSFLHLCVPCFGLVYMILTYAQKSDIPWRRTTGGGPMVHHIVNAWCRENEIKDSFTLFLVYFFSPLLKNLVSCLCRWYGILGC